MAQSQALITTFLTVVSGTLIYLIKVLCDEHWLVYVKMYKSLKRDISYGIVYYANVYHDPNRINKDFASDAIDFFRKQAANLSGFASIRPKYCPLVPSSADLENVIKNLMWLSNNIGAGGNDSKMQTVVRCVEDIQTALGNKGLSKK